MSKPAEPLSMRLAGWFGRLQWRALPEEQRDLAKLRLLDTLGLMLGGSEFEAASIARDRALQNRGAGGASVVGSAVRVPAGWAAFANGIIAHCLDYDDTFPDSVVHPGSMVVPVALAVGEERGASGAEMLTAIAGGYEIAARLASVGGRRFHERGFHASGIFAPLVSAFVAGRLMGLGPEATAAAVGLAASMSGGLMAFLADGSWSKWLHLGWGNFGGILAAQLAADGFRGPAGALDGRHNLYAAFLGNPPVEFHAIAAKLGERWLGETALFKLYPCAHVIQPYIDLALGLREELALEAGDVRRVICTVAPWAVPIVCEPAAEKSRPATMLQAIASLPFHVAAAIVDGRVDLETLAESARNRPAIIALASRVSYIVSPDLEGFAARIEIQLADGRRVEKSGRAAEADAERLGRKFHALADHALAHDRAEELALAVAQLDDAEDAQAITAIVREAAPSIAG
ncbi:MAG TPA: MmgE/PrpD family protein [Candidatus Binataceae bacterium]|nr:MmgE/PrpD family protein [Candidatus Binataceae bacterium]